MAQESATVNERTGMTELSAPLAGGLGGLGAGIAFGLMLQVMMTDVITVAIPALYGQSGVLAGWVIHLFNSVVFGVVFGVAVATTSLDNYADSWGTAGILGVAYGAVVWIVAAGIGMPIWLDLVGFPGAPPLPNFNVMSLIGHAVYGIVLGVGYSLLHH